MSAPRSRRSSVRAVIDKITPDPAVGVALHDALWAVLWNRRYDDVDEPFWAPDAAYTGILCFVRPLDGDTVVTGVDTGETFIVFRTAANPPPIGSRVRLLPAERDRWRIAEATPLGLGIELRFDEPNASADAAWTAPLRAGLRRLLDAVEGRRERLAARRAQLGALNEPAPLEAIWREEMAAISDRVAMQTDYTPAEQTALARARTKGARTADEEERKIQAARKRRFTERGNEEIARFRDEQWPAIRERAEAELKKYADYRTEVVRLEDSLQRLRTLSTRATSGLASLDRIEKASFSVRNVRLEPERLDQPEYAEELLATVELLNSAIPLRAQSSATSFSAYRARTAGPSVIPPRI